MKTDVTINKLPLAKSTYYTEPQEAWWEGPSLLSWLPSRRVTTWYVDTFEQYIKLLRASYNPSLGGFQ